MIWLQSLFSTHPKSQIAISQRELSNIVIGWRFSQRACRLAFAMSGKSLRSNCIIIFNFVSSQSQYVFVHDCILEHINFGDTSIPIRAFHKHLQTLRTVAAGMKKSRLREEFQVWMKHRNLLKSVLSFSLRSKQLFGYSFALLSNTLSGYRPN